MPRGKTAKTKHREQLIYEWAEEHRPVTVRQLFYRLSTLDAVPKTEGGYKSVGNICVQMRLDGEIPFEWIADSTRERRQPKTFESLKDALRNTSVTYRRGLWQDQQGLVEIWLEKEALVGAVIDVTWEWDVPLMVVRGYPSLSFMYSAAEQINLSAEQGKNSHIFYFGDHDPSGKDIFRHIGETLHKFAPQADMTINQVAVTEQQIIDYNLPSRPTKRTDSRSKNFVGDSVELDSIPPAKLRDLVRESIFSVVNQDELVRVLNIEEAEQQSIHEFIEGWLKTG